MRKNADNEIVDAHQRPGDKRPGKQALPGRNEFPRPLFREDDLRFFPHLGLHGLLEVVGLLLP